MKDKKKSSLEKIGYIKTLPKKADINNYEIIHIKDKNEKKCTLYRLINNNKEFDDISNFNESWILFNSYL